MGSTKKFFRLDEFLAIEKKIEKREQMCQGTSMIDWLNINKERNKANKDPFYIDWDLRDKRG